MAQSSVAEIIDAPENPADLFNLLIKHVTAELVPMDLATIDEEFGVLNRTVLFRGLIENCVSYVTQRYTRNCKNLLANPKAGITFYFPELLLPTQGDEPATWQVRLLGATAVELSASHVNTLWANEQLPAQIRAHVFPCGQPVNYAQLKAKHDQFLSDHLKSGKPLQRPETYTAFKFQPQRWDFLKVGSNQIADRVQYRLQENGQWQLLHVAT